MPGGNVRTGPAPDPNALRRDRKDDHWTVLPPEGRETLPPLWPLPGFTSREKELWVDVWRRPQAIMWEFLTIEYEVALYVRKLAEAELPGAATGKVSLVKQFADDLGLSVAGMLRNRWKIGEPTEEVTHIDTRHQSSRNRLRVAK